MCVRFPYVVMVALQEYQLEYAQRGADGRLRKVFLYMPTNNNITIMLFDFTKFKKKKRKKISSGRLERGSACLSFATHY